jgi:hypothetical protein
MAYGRSQHPNAPLTPAGRRRMVEQGWTVTVTAERFQVDAKTVRRWRDHVQSCRCRSSSTDVAPYRHMCATCADWGDDTPACPSRREAPLATSPRRRSGAFADVVGHVPP